MTKTTNGTTATLMMAAWVAGALMACGGGGATGDARRTSLATYAVSTFDPGGTDFTGNWMLVDGGRDGISDLKYPCANEFSVCVPMNADGSIDAITNLCPTVNTGSGTGTWTFTYGIFTDSGCSTKLANLECDPTPNEPLEPGSNLNDVKCKTRNSSKDVTICIYDAKTGAQSGDCTSFKTGSIGNFVWNDVNGNGIQDAGEPGIAGVTVELRDGSGTLLTTNTDAGGFYIFSGLGAGTYQVTVVTPNGSSPTTSLVGSDPTIDSNVSGGTVTLATDNSSDMTVDFGFIYPLGQIGDFVWNDVDNNGLQDAGEAGIQNVEVRLWDSTGTVLLATQWTDIDGHYLFDNLYPGVYTVTVVTPSSGGWAPATSLAGSDRGIDSNVSGETVWLAQPGSVDLTIDFGFVQATGSIGNFVWNDLDHDGIQDAGEPGIAGVTVHLSTGATATTDANGYYQFTGLLAGTYTVSVDAPSGYTPTISGAGSDAALDSNGSPASVTLPTNSSTDQTIDFGFIQPQGAIGDRVWNDLNGNGIQDGGEPGIAGVTVLLQQGGTTIQTATTDANGGYLFTGLMAGTYTVSVITPAGSAPTTALVGGDRAVDSNVSGGTVTLATNGSSDLTIDFGFVYGRIGDFVWYDVDADGIQDVGEPGLAGITMKLLDGGNNLLQTTTTASNGYYEFNTLPLGSYTVVVETPSGFFATLPGVGSDRTIDSNGIASSGGATSAAPVTLTAGTRSDLTIDFGFVQGKTAGLSNRTMEGNETVAPGDWISGGYRFKFANTTHAATTFVVHVWMDLNVTCSGSTTEQHIRVDLDTRSYAVPANSTAWIPTDKQGVVESWMGSLQAPDLCSGGGMNNAKGADFYIEVAQMPPTGSLVDFAFHYRVPAAKGKPNEDCTTDTWATDPNQYNNVCAASWSGNLVDP